MEVPKDEEPAAEAEVAAETATEEDEAAKAAAEAEAAAKAEEEAKALAAEEAATAAAAIAAAKALKNKIDLPESFTALPDTMKDLVEAVLFHTYATERTTITDVSDMMPHARTHARQ